MRKLLNKLLKSRFKIATQLYMGIGFVVLITLVTSLVSWQSFRRIGEAQKQISEESVPELSNAFGIAQQSAALAETAPRLVAASNVDELNVISQSITMEKALFEARLLSLLDHQPTAQNSSDTGRVVQRFEQMRSIGDRLITNIEAVEKKIALRLKLKVNNLKTQNELLELQPKIIQILATTLDDQLYYTATGYRNLYEPRAQTSEYRSERAMLNYRGLASLQEAASNGITILVNAFSIASTPLLEPQRERFQAVSDNISRNRKILEGFLLKDATEAEIVWAEVKVATEAKVITETTATAVKIEVAGTVNVSKAKGGESAIVVANAEIEAAQESASLELEIAEIVAIQGGFDKEYVPRDQSPAILAEAFSSFDRLLELGEGKNNVFVLHHAELELAEQQKLLIDENRELSLALVNEVERIVNLAGKSAAAANKMSEEAVSTGGTTLIFLSTLSIVSAVLVGWLFIGRFLVQRLEWLAMRMRQMAAGDLNEEVRLSGHDEIADMAGALEIFRLSSLEALRVDVAEKLAHELQDKNEELKQAQNQIIMREKLAALGELTAGVAHEIKNPLNFIKNFAEVTVEMIDELQEEIKAAQVSLTDEQKSLIMEISDDLKGNAQRIKEHSGRANQIVHDMLLMGRGGGERQLTAINTLLDEHIRLAFHSARASDSEFQLDIVNDFDPGLGEVEIIPQDFGRLALNLITNACYSTNKRRRELLEQARAAATDEELASAASQYVPRLHVTSKIFDDHFTVSVRDNGVGISKENIEKIFNPFFTTKPANEGTGLGLALSSDIIRAHGGSIEVESKIDEFAHMTISVPLEPPEATVAKDEADKATSKAKALVS